MWLLVGVNLWCFSYSVRWISRISIGIFISGLIIVVNVIGEVRLNEVMVIVIVSLKLLLVVVKVMVVVCG